MRVDIYEPENAEKIHSVIRQIREATGIQISPNRLANLFIASIESAELVEHLTITLKENPDAKAEGKPKRKKPIIKRTTTWSVRV